MVFCHPSIPCPKAALRSTVLSAPSTHNCHVQRLDQCSCASHDRKTWIWKGLSSGWNLKGLRCTIICFQVYMFAKAEIQYRTCTYSMHIGMSRKYNRMVMCHVACLRFKHTPLDGDTRKLTYARLFVHILWRQYTHIFIFRWNRWYRCPCIHMTYLWVK